MPLALCCHPQVCHFPWAQLTLLGTSTCAMGPSVQDHLAGQHPHSSGALFTQGASWSSEQLLSPVVLTGYVPLEGHWSRTACTLADYVTKLLVKTDTKLHSEWLEPAEDSGPGVKPALPACLCVPSAQALFQHFPTSCMQVPFRQPHPHHCARRPQTSLNTM